MRAPIKTLNESQRAFCAASGGAVRLLAPAGCGKTESLLWRCRDLAERDRGEKSRFLLFTFTTAARDELKHRVGTEAVFRSVAGQITIATLNAWGFRRLKNQGHRIQLKTRAVERHYTLHNLLQPIWRRYPRVEAALTKSRARYRATGVLMDHIELLKLLGFRHDRMEKQKDFLKHVDFLEKCGMSAQVRRLAEPLEDLEIVTNLRNPLGDIFEHFVPFWREATQHLFDSATISFEDQKYWAMLDLEKEIARKSFWSGAARYQHILVDEFQDINPLDLSLLRALAHINKTDLTIVGDDDQAIYEWRAATPDFILNPERYIGKPYETVVLDTNYRSPKNIVELSQKLIANNKRRVAKSVSAFSSTNAEVEVLRVPSLSESIDYVVELVQGLLADGTYKNVAIIGRKRSQIIPYQIVFAGRGIPFYAAEDLQVFLSEAFEALKEILAIRARAEMSTSAFGGSPVNDLLTLCDKVKRLPLSKTDRPALHAHLVRLKPKTLRDAVLGLRSYRGTLKGDNQGGRMSESFADSVEGLLKSKDVSSGIAALSEHFDGLKKDYSKAQEDIFYADPPFLYLGDYARRYGADYGAFIEDMECAIATLARVPPEDEDADQPGWKLPLHLMTALRAKGKEFDAVIILDANEDIWPSKLAQTEHQQEAERRVFYVAMTRVKRRLVFLVNDFILGEAVPPTRYLKEMGLAPTPIEAPR